MQNIGLVEGSVWPDAVSVKGDKVYVAKSVEQVECTQDDETYIVYRYELDVYTTAEYESVLKQNEILDAVNLSNDEIANEAVDAYTLELMEAGVL